MKETIPEQVTFRDVPIVAEKEHFVWFPHELGNLAQQDSLLRRHKLVRPSARECVYFFENALSSNHLEAIMFLERFASKEVVVPSNTTARIDNEYVEVTDGPGSRMVPLRLADEPETGCLTGRGIINSHLARIAYNDGMNRLVDLNRTGKIDSVEMLLPVTSDKPENYVATFSFFNKSISIEYKLPSFKKFLALGIKPGRF